MNRSGSSRSARAFLALVVAAALTMFAVAGMRTGTGAAHAQSPATTSAALEPLAIVSGDRRHVFSVEVMRTEEQRAMGLMYRRFLPADRGMLFDFKQIQPVQMWMQNTYISLDMIFIRADGIIARIAEHTEPLSTRIVPSGEAVLSVLEVNAGTAARLGIKPGDRVTHPLFDK